MKAEVKIKCKPSTFFEVVFESANYDINRNRKHKIQLREGMTFDRKTKKNIEKVKIVSLMPSKKYEVEIARQRYIVRVCYELINKNGQNYIRIEQNTSPSRHIIIIQLLMVKLMMHRMIHQIERKASSMEEALI